MTDKGLEIGKAYDPAPIEDKWYSWWLETGLFHSEPDEGKEPFSIVIPPPNVTGSLHMGHALNNTLQDITCRYMRMRGKNVMWLPGTDHAGIATQNVVERRLQEEGKSRHDVGREAFVEKVWEWKEEYGNRIINQLKKLGASCDWSRERFTMDEGLSRAVRAVFVRLYDEGLVYKGKYIINWCPRCRTALSDLEVEHEPTEGMLYYVSYPFVEESGSITVATTRPETILGDVAVAVHPRDEKNARFIGKRVRVPLCDREIPVIEDNMVDPEFGTGLVKITPAHDPNDFLVGERHGLEPIQVIDETGKMSEAAGNSFVGMDRYDARKKIVTLLEESGQMVRKERHEHAVGRCYRCGTMIEPFLSEQWFVKTAPLASEAMRAVREKDIRIVPEQWETTYFQWMENIRDWCISRQLWWGHRIPAWTCGDCGAVTVSEQDPDRCEACKSTNIHQEEDVLDTWFSSALWPFSTLGWPDETEDLEYYYPTNLLTTGFDILFFWVARMIMMGLKFMNEIPFHTVYIHALVRDEQGQKMSKSKGNVIDPLEIIEEYGADSLRLTLAALTVQGRDIFLSRERIEAYRHFLNKLWNAARFAGMYLHGGGSPEKPQETSLRDHDSWILARRDTVIKEVSSNLDTYHYGEAAKGLYEFVWSEFCDWYLEMAKPALRGEEGIARKEASRWVLEETLKDILKMLHPFIPFVTEELWNLFEFGAGSIEKGNWPIARNLLDESEESEKMSYFQEIVRSFRNLRAEGGFPPQKRLSKGFLVMTDMNVRFVVEQNTDLLSLLTNIEDFSFLNSDGEKPPKALTAALPFGEIFLPVGDLLDVPAEIRRLQQEMQKSEKAAEKCRKKLKNGKFLQNAPQEVVEKEKWRLEEHKKRIHNVERNLESLRRA
ncbi:MAG: valine--tRNA ligase [Thermovirgaceae bacterium]